MISLPGRIARPATLAAVLGLLAAALLSVSPLPAMAETTCHRVAAAGGSDAAAGTAAAPYATVRQLASSLSAGQTGCVRGTLSGDTWISRPGITITSEPGQRGKVTGQIVIDPAADNVTVSHLDLHTSNMTRPSPIVLGDDAKILANDITNNHSLMLCMIVGAKGHDSGARADRVLIQGNRIHHCGVTDNHRHGLYMEHTLGAKIIANVFHDNADRAIQLYPDSQGTLIAGNIIDGNGEGIIFSGNGGVSSGGTTVRGNIISWPRLRAGVESWYPAGTPAGVGNVVEQNCLYGRTYMIDDAAGGFTHRDNTTADPLYVDRAAKDYRLREGSPCAAILAAGRALAETFPLPVPTAPTPPPTEPTPTEPTPTEPAPTEPAPPKPIEPTPTEPAPTEPAPTEPAPTEPIKVKPPKPAPPAKGHAKSEPAVRIAVDRRRGGRVALRVSLGDEAGTAAQTLIEVRVGAGQWKAVAAPRLQPGRQFVKKLRLPRGRTRIAARATVVDAAPAVVTNFR